MTMAKSKNPKAKLTKCKTCKIFYFYTGEPVCRYCTNQEKYCYKCENWLPIKGFGKELFKPLGLSNICKNCTNLHINSEGYTYSGKWSNKITDTISENSGVYKCLVCKCEFETQSDCRWCLHNEKYCFDCKEWRPANKFWKNNKLLLGLSKVCTYCRYKKLGVNLGRGEISKEFEKLFASRAVKQYKETKTRKVAAHTYKLYKETVRLQKERADKLGLQSFTMKEWLNLIREFGNTCLCCGELGIKLSPDHVIPLSKGGLGTIDNIQPLCWPCNHKKRVGTTDYRIGIR